MIEGMRLLAIVRERLQEELRLYEDFTVIIRKQEVGVLELYV